jgi:hypothetical protein
MARQQRPEEQRSECRPAEMTNHCLVTLAVDTTLMLAPADNGILLARAGCGKSKPNHSDPFQECTRFDDEDCLDCHSAHALVPFTNPVE